MSTRRLFVALNLPQGERERIHQACRPLRDHNLPVRWVDPENYHITLKFLGEVRADRLKCLEGTIAQAAAGSAPFAAALHGFSAFPDLPALDQVAGMFPDTVPVRMEGGVGPVR